MNTPPALVADRYRLVQLIGSGGMGVVWQAYDERLERTVALKLLRTQPELTDDEREITTKRAMREARISAGLHHPHAVPVFDVVEHEGQPCIVMQLIESTPLSALMQEHGTFTPGQAARVGAEIGSALAAAHRRRIVHRDVKPGNILIREDGSAMISDFGIAQALGDTTITATGLVHGTPAYLAPEVARGEPSSFASDVFSLGSTLYAMLEGAPPFGTDANAIALLHRVAQGAVPVAERAGPLEPVLREMLSPDPKQRPDMATVTRRLSELADELTRTDATAPADREDTPAPTVPVAGAATAAAAAAAAAGGVAAGAGAGATAAAGTDRVTAPEPSPPTVPAETRVIGETAATESLGDVDAERTPVAEPAATRPERLAEPLFPWMAETPTAPEPTPAPQGEEETGRRPGRTAMVIGALVTAGLLVIGAILLFNGLRQDGGTAAGPETEPAPTAAESSPAETPAEESPAPAETSEPPPETTEPPPVSAEQRAVEMLQGYYALVPGDLDTAWNLMTEDYQVNHVGGRDAYEAFWGDITAVEIADVQASGDQAQATLTYTFADGRVVREVTAYQLVDEGGTLKIAASEVLSSTTL